MPRKVLIDAGPIVAYLRAGDQFHAWAVKQFQQFTEFTTCEAVLAEACARLAYYRLDQSKVIDLVVHGALVVNFDAGQSAQRLARVMRKYADRPMDLADACLVLMTEQFANCLVVTLDEEDFAVYRRHEREIVPYISPPG